MQKGYERLIKKLNRFIREYYKNLILRGCIYSLLGLISTLIIFSAIEHFNFFNTIIRSILFWSYCAIATFVIIKFIITPAIKMLRLSKSLTHEEAAKIIGVHFDEVSDKLTNILELKSITSGSESLIHASIDQKIKDIELTPFNHAIDWRKTINYSKYLTIPIIIIILLLLSGNKQVISDSTLRIINYNTYFEKPAPFYFSIDNKSLSVVEKNNFQLDVSITGSELPKEVYINYNGRTKKMNKSSEAIYSYTFAKVTGNLSFYLSANNEYSREYSLNVLGRPEIENLEITIIPPNYTGLKSEIKKNTGSITVPQGSLLVWKIKAEQTDTLNFKIDGNSNIISNKVDGYFEVKKTIKKESDYRITLANSKVSFIDTSFYHIKIITDRYPTISINRKDTINNMAFVNGTISDDYGFFSLQSVRTIYGLNRDTVIKESIAINEHLRSQPFLEPMISPNSMLNPGESMDFYLIVRDNDSKNGYKTTQSETLTLNAPTKQETQEEYEENNQAIKDDITSEISMLKNLEKELTDFEKELIEKDSLDWRDRKRLEQILEKQANLEKKIEDLQNTSKLNFEQLNSTSPPTEEILKKQQALQELFDEIMPDEMKDLYRELNELKNELDKNELQQKLKDLQLSNEDIEKELDRNLEILKQVEFDQKLESIIDNIEELEKAQSMLAEQKDKTIQEKLNNQKKHAEEFQNIRNEIQEMKRLNRELENKNNLEQTQEIEDEIKQSLEEGTENLEKKNKKRASKSQKKTSEKLGELANLFKSMKKENEKSQQYEDMDVLRQILENLVYFSIEEENILLEFEALDKDDPRYVELMHDQQNLRDAARVIEDSLFALSKRVPQVSSKINREINAIDKKTASAIDYLRERLTLKAVQDQQFIMTSANNLAVVLSTILEQMQQELASDLPSTQQCEKPGKGSPKPSDLKKMQQELSDHLKEMQKQMKEGNKNGMGNEGMSKKLVEMLAKQELIRQSLEELKGDMNDKDGFKALQDAIEDMKKTEEDIANKKLTIESLSRQKDIITRLLKVEEALREQGEDEKRESKFSNTEYERIIQDVYEKYEREKLKQTEMLKTTPPSLNTYYKNKVDRYFNLMLQ